MCATAGLDDWACNGDGMNKAATIIAAVGIKRLGRSLNSLIANSPLAQIGDDSPGRLPLFDGRDKFAS